jgi:tRNA (cmo5U34)-methyltransferase
MTAKKKTAKKKSGKEGARQFNVGEYFDEMAANYDRRIVNFIPGYAAMHATSRALLQAELPADAKVLIAGAGTGAEAVLFARRNPRWQIAGFDPSAKMLKIARRRAREAGVAKARFYVGGDAQAVVVPPYFDGATAILVMHFLPDDGAKLRFVRGIAKRLKRGGAFILCDGGGDWNSADFQFQFGGWRAFQLAHRPDPENVAAAMANMRGDLALVSAKRTREILRAAGFCKIRKFYQAFLFSAYVAHKQ